MTGHVRKRGSGSFELKFDVGTDPLTGRRRVRYVSFKGTKRAAELELARLVSENAAGNGVDPSRITLAEFFDRWERDWARTNVSAKTFERYSELLRKHVRPRIGNVRLQRLRPVALTELYSVLSQPTADGGGGLAARTVGHVHRVLHRALGHAAQWNLAQQNIAALVSPPRVPQTEIETRTPAEFREIISKLEGKSIYPIACFALATGMRRGELCALRWKDVDLERGLVRVERSIEQTSAGLRFKSPKTRYGRRTISLPQSAIQELRQHWKVQAAQRLSLGLGKAPADGLVFARWDGEARYPDALSNDWAAEMRAQDLRLPFHSLRHSHASGLIAAGMDILTISRRLGHANPTITLNVYGHLVCNTDDRAALLFDAALSGKERNGIR